MRFLLTCLALLIAAVLLGGVLAQEKGFVIIGFHGQVWRLSVVFFGILLASAVGVLYLLVHGLRRAWRAPRELRYWARHRRAAQSQAALADGLRALLRGEWAQAEGILVRGARRAAAPQLHYLAAARAAQAQGAVDRRDRYLEAAADDDDGPLAAALTRADGALQAGRLAELRGLLDQLAKTNADHEQVLRLEVAWQRASGRWPDVLALTQKLARHKIISAAQRDEWAAEALRELVAGRGADAGGGKALIELWNTLPRSQRKQPAVMLAQARALNAAGQSMEAEALTRALIRREYGDAAVLLYGEIIAPDGLAQLARAERWLSGHAGDPALLLTLSRLSLRQGLWGKARSYLEELIAMRATPEAYRMLAEVLEQLGEREAAGRCHRTGLRLATSASGTALATPA